MVVSAFVIHNILLSRIGVYEAVDGCESLRDPYYPVELDSRLLVWSWLRRAIAGCCEPSTFD
jgi:hypothetical protein